MEYIPIDSLSDIHMQSNIILKLKNNNIALEVNNKKISFIQEYVADSITLVGGNNYPFLSSPEDENVEIRLTIGKLLSIDENFICVSAKYQGYHLEKDEVMSRKKTIDTLCVQKNDLQGVMASIPKKTSTIYRTPYSQWQIIGGYHFNVQEHHKNNHILELGVAKVIDGGGIEPAGWTYYFANEFLFNSKDFSIGPKFGGSLYLWGVKLGSEFVYYTNFKDNTLHWVPYFGFGIGAGKIFLAGHVPFYNKKYPVNDFSVGLTIPIYSISKKKIKPVNIEHITF